MVSSAVVSAAVEVVSSAVVSALADVFGASADRVVLVASSAVVSASAAAAAAKEAEAEESMIQYGSQTPATEQREMAKEVAWLTSEPLQFLAIQSATSDAQVVMTQRHPVSQYGHGVEEVACSTQGLAHSGKEE